MKKITITALVLFASLATYAQEIQWMTFEQAVAANEAGADKPVFIDVYTDWCGWCKRMEQTTFRDPQVAAYMNENFLNVKLDGEERDTIMFKGQAFTYVASGRRGYNQLPAALLNGKLSYPTVVFLNAEFQNLSPVPGYQPAEPFLKIARYFGDGIYLNTSWEEYASAADQDTESEN